MKKIYLPLLLLIALNSFSQDITVYGFLPSQPDQDFLRLGIMDPITGTIANEDTINSINAYALGSSTYDAVNKAFMFIGVDTDFNFRLVSRSIRLTTLYDPIITETINDLQYDMNSTRTYGLGNYKSDSVLIDSANNIWWYEYATRFLEVDQDSGYITELTLMPDISAIPIGSSTFDANTGHYIVNAYDTNFQEVMVFVEAETGTVVSQAPTGLNPGDYLNNLEYNNEDDKIYGFYRGNNNQFFALISLDPQDNLAVDTVYVFDDLLYFVQGSAVFDQASQHYIMFYIDSSNVSRIANIDVVAGTMTANPVFTGSLTELEVDNTEYALAKYHAVSVSEFAESIDLNFYPNPVNRQGELMFKSKDIQDVRVYDLSGRMIARLSEDQLRTGRLKIENYQTGLYLVRMTIGQEIITQKLMVR